MTAKRWITFIEILTLILISIVGWSIGSESRIFLSGLDGEDYSDFVFSLFMTFSGFYAYKTCALYLSKEKWSKANLAMIVVGVLIVLWETLIFWLYTVFYYQEPFLSTSYIYTDIQLVLFLTVAFGLYLWVRYFRTSTMHSSEHKNEHQADHFLQTFIVSKANTRTVVNTEEVKLFYTTDKLVWMYVSAGNKYLIDHTLKDLEVKLDPREFFRINRQVIMSRKAVKGYHSLDHQKLQIDLNMEGVDPQDLVVSKYNAAHFKKWLKDPSLVPASRVNP
jgi:membrane protein implicated in regulation of membrane protease activity